MTHDLIDSLKQALDNIERYRIKVRKEPRLAARMTHVHAWYAARSDDGTWLFAPSKFVGYADNTAGAYLSGTKSRNGRETEAVLKRWFNVVQPSEPLGAELHDALRAFINAHGHSGPRKNARICVAKSVSAGGPEAAASAVRDRIHIDASICGGRPHIAGTRVRVSDILDLLASGASPADILADYPYPDEAGLSAGLAFGAAASAHRIILAA